MRVQILRPAVVAVGGETREFDRGQIVELPADAVRRLERMLAVRILDDAPFADAPRSPAVELTPATSDPPAPTGPVETAERGGEAARGTTPEAPPRPSRGRKPKAPPAALEG